MATDPSWVFENFAGAAEYIDELEKQRNDLIIALGKCKFDSLNMSFDDLNFIRDTVNRIKSDINS